MSAMERGSTGGAAGSNGKLRAELQEAARTLIDDLRQRQEPPEQILLQIKEFLAERGLRAGFPAGEGTGTGEGMLYREIISWSIRYYYDGGKG